MTGAETTAAFLLERVRAARGAMWDEGRGRVPAPVPPSGPALQTFVERRVRGVPEAVVRGLFAWDRGERPVDLLSEVPAARRVLSLQARGRRCVCLVADAAALAHGDPRHPDGLTFALHDLCHLEKFVAPEHHPGQVGFFRIVERALDTPAMIALERDFDDTWRADRDYVIADMNGSAVFLFAALKMKLNMAVRRRLDRGVRSGGAGRGGARRRRGGAGRAAAGDGPARRCSRCGARGFGAAGPAGGGAAAARLLRGLRGDGRRRRRHDRRYRGGGGQ